MRSGSDGEHGKVIVILRNSIGSRDGGAALTPRMPSSTFAAVVTDATSIDVTSIEATPNDVTISDAVSTATALHTRRSTITHVHSNADATSSVPRLPLSKDFFPYEGLLKLAMCRGNM